MTIILEPGFESISNWVYSEVDTLNNISGGQSNFWTTEGSYAYALSGFTGSPIGDYGQIKQTINIPSNFGILFDIFFRFYTGSNVNRIAQVLIDSTIVWEKSFLTSSYAYYDQRIDLTSFSGTHDLIFRLYVAEYSSNGAIPLLLFDNIREIYIYNDIYVNSSSGKDSNAGDSCASGHPVQTFGKAYSLLNSGGTIHVCNSGADFSAETVTLNKSYSIDLNGSSGYFYGPKAS